MTDERIADLDAAVAGLRRGDGIVFRHYATPLAERRRLFARVLAVAKRRGLVLVRAGDIAMRGEMGVHGGGRMVRPGVRTWPAHSRIEAVAGVRAGADALFVSPVFSTRSHFGAPALGPIHAARMGWGLRASLIALGGMDAQRFASIRRLGFGGWAAIDAWSGQTNPSTVRPEAVEGQPAVSDGTTIGKAALRQAQCDRNILNRTGKKSAEPKTETPSRHKPPGCRGGRR